MTVTMAQQERAALAGQFTPGQAVWWTSRGTMLFPMPARVLVVTAKMVRIRCRPPVFDHDVTRTVWADTLQPRDEDDSICPTCGQLVKGNGR